MLRSCMGFNVVLMFELPTFDGTVRDKPITVLCAIAGNVYFQHDAASKSVP